MIKLGLNEIRERYLSFFEHKEHLRAPSFPLVPQNDNSLLLINAGMAPLKNYFTGKEEPPAKRMTTCQKCIRTPDIERVGKTARHGTFFEMLGNFSFGDYFKKEATMWAWEFITQDLELPVDRLWVSIFQDDDESFDIWVNHVGVDAGRIVRLGKEDNFWEIGVGPCGPCSELYFDRGEQSGCGSPDCAVGCDCDRFVEFWNLVFTQFDKNTEGEYAPLAKKNIDTGMGLERIAAIMQGVNSLFDVDTITKITEHVSKMTGIKYGASPITDVSLRVITDHIRSTTFMVSDGVLASNEGRGYVLRRLLRRAARHGKMLGLHHPFLYKVVDTVIAESGDAYPNLRERADYIKNAIRIEEESFQKTIHVGMEILMEYIDSMKSDTMSGEMAFKLYDTYGFPIDLTAEILDEKGIKIDRDGFEVQMKAQRDRSRSSRKNGDIAGWDENEFFDIKKSTEFVGYDTLEATARVVAVSENDGLTTIVLDKTPFYPESGGQTADTGVIESDSFKMFINDAKKLANGVILHTGIVEKGIAASGDCVTALVDTEKRMATSRNHTTTHLLQKALKDILGDHIAQSGSMVNPERLRFDFTHFSGMTEKELLEVEILVNTHILAGHKIDIKETGIDEARAMGATALFGEKYGSTVRVVSMGDYSMELCGGTHLPNTAMAGLFKIISESGIAAGTRRIEGVTGTGVLDMLVKSKDTISEVAEALKANPSDVTRRAAATVSELKDAQREIESLKAKLAGSSADSLIDNAIDVKGIKLITAQMNDLDVAGLRTAGDTFKSKLDCGVILLASNHGGKITFIAMSTPSAIEKGAHSGNLVRGVAQLTGGSGGGKPDSAQAGGKDISKVEQALNEAKNILEGMIK